MTPSTSGEKDQPPNPTQKDTPTPSPREDQSLGETDDEGDLEDEIGDDLRDLFKEELASGPNREAPMETAAPSTLAKVH